MRDLFDYDELLPPSDEVVLYGLEQDFASTDWRMRASEHFQKNEPGQMRNLNAAIGALAIATHQERTQRSTAYEIDYLESWLSLEYAGSND
jgi:hypothetical protein